MPASGDLPTAVHSQASQAGSLRLAIIDEDEAIHASMTESMKSLAPEWSVDSFFSVDEAILHLPGSRPRAAILDFCRNDHHGVACARSLIQLLPKLRIILHTTRGGGPLVMLAVMAGAHGFLIKPQPTQEVVAAVLRAVSGETVFCSKAQGSLAAAIRQMNLMASPGVLSPREMEILTCVSNGMYQKEIADILRIERGTVHAHLARIYKKLNVHSAAEAIRALLERSQQPHADEPDGLPPEIS